MFYGVYVREHIGRSGDKVLQTVIGKDVVGGVVPGVPGFTLHSLYPFGDMACKLGTSLEMEYDISGGKIATMCIAISRASGDKKILEFTPGTIPTFDPKLSNWEPIIWISNRKWGEEILLETAGLK